MDLKSIAISLSVLLLTGCAIQPMEPKISVANGIRIYSTTSEIQLTFMKDHGTDERMCVSRGSDVADTESTSLGLSYGNTIDDESVSEGSSKAAVNLGGRSPSVLIIRELMFRACELTMNLNLSKEEALELYHKTLNSVSIVSQFQSGSGVNANALSIPTSDNADN